MAETLVENRTCSACGANVRSGALFCYNCGGSVAPAIPVAENHKPAEVVLFRDEKIVEETPKEENNIPVSEPEILETPVEKPIEKPNIHEDAKLKSAASLRKKAKTFQKPKVEEILWTGHENAPNGWFILVALILTLFAVGIFYLAMSLK
jgi:hypothetical protein